MARQRGSGSIYKQRGSSNWWIKYYRNGKPYYESARTDDHKKAKLLLRHRLAEIATGSFYGPKVERVRVEELAEDFLRDYRINGRKSLDDAEARWNLHLKPFFGHMRAVEVGSDLLARYVDQRQTEHAENATINRELAALKRMFKLGQQASPPKVYHAPTFPKLVERNTRTGFVEDAQYQAIADACAAEGLWMRALFETAHTFGWRVSELLNLRVRQVELPNRTIRLNPGETKNDDGRLVTMTEPVHKLLKACVADKQPDDFVFTRENGKPVRDFRESWAKVCGKAGVPELLFHDLRRSAARNLRRAGVAEGVIQKIGGWRTRAVFERYAIVSETDIVDAMQKLAKRTADRQNGDSYGDSGQLEAKVPKSNVVN